MFVPAATLPADSRIWIYQADRNLTSEEILKIGEYAKGFINSWTAHQQDIKGSFEIRHHLFLILMIDEDHASASGCSIDKSIHFIQKLEKEFSLSFLNRQIIAINNEGEVKLIKRNIFEKMLQSGELSEDSIVFNNLIETKQDLDHNWQVPVRNSWHSAIRF